MLFEQWGLLRHTQAAKLGELPTNNNIGNAVQLSALLLFIYYPINYCFFFLNSSFNKIISVFILQQREQLDRLKNDQIHQAEFHAQQIKEHEEAIQRHKEFLNNLHK